MTPGVQTGTNAPLWLKRLNELEAEGGTLEPNWLKKQEQLS